MGSLNNLYISQSFQSLVHFGTDWTASANLIQLQDGLGNNLGVSLNTNGDITAVGSITASNLYAPNISASNLYVSGTLTAYEIHAIIYSSSTIFTSGSNIIGDNANEDVQTLIGRTIVTGSLEVTSSIKASGDISSSTISGIGNVTLYSQSVDNRLDLVEATASYLNTTFSSSVDSRLDSLEAFSSSLIADFVTQAELNAVTQSLNNFTQSYYQDSSSFNTRINNGITIQDDGTYVLGAQAISFGPNLSVSSAGAGTASVSTIGLAITGSNTFIGTQTISGSLNVAGGNEINLGDAQNAFKGVTFKTVGSNNGNAQAIIYSSQSADFYLGAIADDFSYDSELYVTTTNNGILLKDWDNNINNYSTFLTIPYNTGTSIPQFNRGLVVSSSLEVTGSMVYSGSVRGQVNSITISGGTATLDCSKGNFFTLSLPAGTTTLNASNIKPGETISLRITNQTTASVFASGSSVKFPNGFSYVPTNIANSTDIITFLTFDTTSIYAVAANYFQ